MGNTWIDKLRFGVAKILASGTELPWRGRINFGEEFVCSDDEANSATGVTLDRAALRRVSYDATATVTLTAAAGWVEAWRSEREDLIETNGNARDIRLDMMVTDGTGSTAPRDRIELLATYTRRDANDDTITNDDDDVSSTAAAASVSWAVRLPAAYADDETRGEFAARLRRGTGGDSGDIILELYAPAAITRSAVVDIYLGRER